jgi:hypothetical protein
MVISGFPRQDELKGEIAALEDNDAKQAAKQRFSEAWRLYHDVVADNRDETLDAIERSWRDVSAYDHVINLMSVVGMLRRNGKPETASAFIDQWLLERSGPRLAELGLRELQTFERITDQEFLDKRTAFVEAHRQHMELGVAMDRMAERAFDERAIAAIAAAPPSDLARWMEENPGNGLPYAIKNTLDLHGRPDAPDWTRAAETMREALLIVSAKSEWTAARIEAKYGVAR